MVITKKIQNMGVLFVIVFWTFLLASVFLSCSGSSSSATADGGVSSTGELITGAPVEIPAPVAKSLTPIDPETMTNEGLVVSWETDEPYVGVIIDGVFVAVVTTSSGVGSLTLSTDQLDTTIALVTMPATSVSNGSYIDGADVSWPVLFSVDSSTEILTVLITNTSTSVVGDSTTPAINIEFIPKMAINELGTTLAFSGSKEDGTFVVATISTSSPSSPTIVVDDLLSLPYRLKYDVDGNLYFTARDVGTLNRVDATTLEVSGVVPADAESAENRSYDTNDSYILTTVDDSGDDVALALINRSDLTTAATLKISNEGLVDRAWVDIIDDSKAILIKDVPSANLLHAQIINLLTNSIVELFDSTTPMSDPVYNSTSNSFIYVCNNSICDGDTLGNTTTIIQNNSGLPWINPQYSSGVSFIWYEMFNNTNFAAPDNTHLAYINSEADNTCPMLGGGLVVSPVNDNLAYYIFQTSDGSNQIGIHNMANLSVCPD